MEHNYFFDLKPKNLDPVTECNHHTETITSHLITCKDRLLKGEF